MKILRQKVKEEWADISISELIIENLGVIVKWVFIFGFSSYVIGYALSKVFLNLLPDACNLIK